jgi:hypothetical protein
VLDSSAAFVDSFPHFPSIALHHLLLILFHSLTHTHSLPLFFTRYADSIGVPYKYVLLDSWWYYQGVHSGVSNWIGRPDIFPHGNDYLRNATGWPIMGHNRFWAIDNVYAKQNGGQYDFVIEKSGVDGGRDYAWPSEQKFWDDLLYVHQPPCS